ncbi:glycosyltransferase family 2 protein [Desulfobulbus propionicus]
MNRHEMSPQEHLYEQLSQQFKQPRFLARPLCSLKRIWRGIFRKIPVRLLPLTQLQQNNSAWQATGAGAQFALISDCKWSQCSGWYGLKLGLTADGPVQVRLLFDLDQGFDEPIALHCQPSGHEEHLIPLFVPPHCQAIRLALCDRSMHFSIAIRSMERLRAAPELQGCYLAQKNVYEQLGWREGNGAFLVPEKGLRPQQSGYSWQAITADASFRIRHLRLTRRWYMIEMRLCSEVSQGNAVFVFDDGQHEPARLELPFHSTLTMKRLYKPDTSPQNLRFLPLDQPAAFSVERLHFEPVPALFAYNRMLRRLRNTIPRYRGWKLRTIWWDILRQAHSSHIKTLDLLLLQYTLTFPAHYQQGTYENWRARIEQPEFANLVAIHLTQKKFHISPLVTVILPVNNENYAWIQESIASVQQQSYHHWHLHIIAQENAPANLRQMLDKWAQLDNRIFLCRPDILGNFETITESHAATVTADWYTLLDANDLLTPHALHFVVQSMQQHPDARIIYSDEDRVDEQGQRLDPCFKPDWNPDLFFSQDYVHRLCVYHRSLVQYMGGTGRQGDYARLLHCLPHLRKDEIVHIPKILYHNRISAENNCFPLARSINTVEVDLEALRRFFSTQDKKEVEVEPARIPGTFRVRYPVPQPPPLVSLIIPTRDMIEVLEPCLRSILDKTLYSYYEIIVIDNDSQDPATLAYLNRLRGEDDRVRVLSYPHPFNYSSINNFAVAQAKGQIIGLVNNDVEVISPEWLTEMVSHALRPEIGCVGAKLYYTDETVQHGGVILGLGGVAGHAHRHFSRQAPGYCNRLQVVHNLSAVTAACLVVRKSVYLEVGGLEEVALQVAFNDVDFCIKVREAGYRNLWTPYAELFHHESKSRGMDDTPEKKARFQREFQFMQDKWGLLLQEDPCYNPNLTFCDEDFSIG